MKIFGSIRELVSAIFRISNGQQVTLKPNEAAGFSYTANREVSLPKVDADATLVAAGEIVNDDIKAAAGIVYSKLALSNSIVDGDISPTAAIVDTKLATISTAGKVANSATTATSTNTASAIVARDGSGNFAAGSITASSFLGTLTGGVTDSSLSGSTSVSYAVTTANADSTITPVADRPVILLNNQVSTTINSVDNPSAGKQIFLVNDGLVDLTINNDNGGSTGIFTGTGSPFTLKTNASVSLLYNSSQNRWVLSGGAGGSGSGGTVLLVGQSTTSLAVGDVMYLNGTVFTKAQADAANTAEVVGVVSKIIDASSFELTLAGQVAKAGWGLTPGEVYFLSAATAGGLSASEPDTIGHVSVPVGIADTSSTLIVAPKRGAVVGGTNARTELTLSSASTTDIFNAAAPTLYQAGELTGWVKLGSSQKFYFRAPFAQNGAETNWNISPSYVGDTPPAGFSLQMNSSGVISITCPSFAGNGLVNYALNAPAVGATFPLAVDASSLTTGTVSSARLPAGQYPGSTSGSAIAAGYVGEVKSIVQAASLNIASNANYTNVNSAFVTVTPGVWRVFCRAGFVQTSAVTLSEGLTLGYSTDSGATFTDFDNTVARSNSLFGTLPAATNVSITNSRAYTGGDFGIITVTSNTNYYFKIANRVTAGSLDIVGAALYFVRIA